MLPSFVQFLGWAALATATPLRVRAVDSLNEAATAEAHQRDNTATRAFSDVQIKTSDGRCLFVDKLSGDFRANLTPIQVADCGSTDGQGWDIITAGKHIRGENVMLVVSTLTQACLNFDQRRQAGNQVLLFSCGGRADGSGEVSDGQLFAFNGNANTIAFRPQNQAGSCFTVKGNALDVASCSDTDANQVFTIGEGTSRGGNDSTTTSTATTDTTTAGLVSSSSASTGSIEDGKLPKPTSTCAPTTRTVTVTVTDIPSVAPPATTSSDVATTTARGNQGIPTVNPTDPVPVSRAGGVLQPSAAAEAHQRDETADRVFENVEIRAPNGKCLFVDPTAGDFRQNLIPISLVTCSGSPNEKWDVISQGKHNEPNPNRRAVLVVSALTQGCISFDGRRNAGDTVVLFSCGGRAAGEGGTDPNQLFPNIGQTSFAFAPTGEGNRTCILPGSGGDKLDSGPCPDDGSQLFSVFE
ncbi:hypothetical protein VTJ83DRAFT_1312 [Remersonia thermophila]|uniref:Ricin B lectin domain-containing protein n=1 Tax=Remersonia thermophila TaxID=72144 RepID=A0ABR4DPL5_9PEZI